MLNYRLQRSRVNDHAGLPNTQGLPNTPGLPQDGGLPGSHSKEFKAKKNKYKKVKVNVDQEEKKEE